MTYRSATCLVVLLLTLPAVNAAPDSTIPPGRNAQFSSDGRLKLPADYRDWIFLSSGLDMSYLKNSSVGHSMFDNVFADPQAYGSFVRTGMWPEGTVLVKEDRLAAQKGSINEAGEFQSDKIVGIEVHLKDSKRFAGGWRFFFFSSRSDEAARAIPTSADCYSCHQQHGAVDTTFVQFYPTLLSIAMEKRTLDRSYRP